MLAKRRRQIVERARQLLLEAHVSGPPVPVEQIAKNLGILIIRDPLPGQDVSGFYLRRADQQVIGVNSVHPDVRQRFTIAHELGHAVLSAHDHLYVDRVARLRDARSAKGTDLSEVEANAFAAELLMPQEMLTGKVRERGGLDVYDQDEVRHLAEEFQVSTQALMIRLSYLDLAPAEVSPW